MMTAITHLSFCIEELPLRLLRALYPLSDAAQRRTKKKRRLMGRRFFIRAKALDTDQLAVRVLILLSDYSAE